jgi:hypothetical protein
MDCKLANVVTRNSDFSDGEKTRVMRNDKGSDGKSGVGDAKITIRSNERGHAIGQTFT